MTSRKPKNSEAKPRDAKLTLNKQTLKDLAVGSKGAAGVRGAGAVNSRLVCNVGGKATGGGCGS